MNDRESVKALAEEIDQYAQKKYPAEWRGTIFHEWAARLRQPHASESEERPAPADLGHDIIHCCSQCGHDIDGCIFILCGSCHRSDADGAAQLRRLAVATPCRGCGDTPEHCPCSACRDNPDALMHSHIGLDGAVETWDGDPAEWLRLNPPTKDEG